MYFVQQTSGDDKVLVNTNLFPNLDAALVYGQSLIDFNPECKEVWIIDQDNVFEAECILTAESTLV